MASTGTTIQTEIERLKKAKADIKASIISKGGIVSDTALIGDYADIIKNLEDLFNTYNYNYRVAPVDVAGLKEINWDDDDINYFKYNTLIPKGEDIGDTYKVSEANKQIVINSTSDINTYKNNPDFKYCPKFDTSDVVNMDSLFETCRYIRTIPLINTSKVTNMSYMFRWCSSLTTISQLDTHNVTNMNRMFENCKSLTSIPLFDTSKVTNMYNMFYNCKSLTTIPQLVTSNVTDMSYMFSGCFSLISIPLLDTSSVTNMSSMFYNCKSLVSVPKLDVTNLTNSSDAFYGCSSLTTLGGFLNLKTNLNISNALNLTHDSLMNVINNAADVTSSPKTLTLGATNLSKLTTSEKEIATNKGWILE